MVAREKEVFGFERGEGGDIGREGGHAVEVVQRVAQLVGVAREGERARRATIGPRAHAGSIAQHAAQRFACVTGYPSAAEACREGRVRLGAAVKP